MKKKECSKFGDKLKELRKREKMTQSDLSNKLNINRVTITKYETGERTPTTDDIISLAKYFNVSTDYLLGITDNSTTNTDLQAVCNYTGLHENVIEIIKDLKALGKISVLNDIINSPDFPFLIDGIIDYNETVYKIIDYYSKSHNFTNEDENNIKKAKQYLERQGYIINPVTDTVKSTFDAATCIFQALIMNIIATQKEFLDDYHKNIYPKHLKYEKENIYYNCVFDDDFYAISRIMDYVHDYVGIKLQVEVYENDKHNPPKK